MRTIISILALFFVSMATSFAADENKPIDKNVDVGYFNKIGLHGNVNVIYTQGDKPEVRIHGIKEWVDCIEAYQDGKTLRIFENKKKVVNGLKELFNIMKQSEDYVCVYVTSPDLIGVSLIGSGNFESKTKLDTDNIELNLNGSGDMEFSDIICDNFKAVLTGSGDIEINKVESITSYYSVRGSGDIESKQNKVRKTDISLVGSGDIQVHCKACDEVNANLIGSGDITISGEMKKVNQTKRGSGDIVVK